MTKARARTRKHTSNVTKTTHKPPIHQQHIMTSSEVPQHFILWF